MALAMAACTEDLSVAPELVNGTDQSPENAISFGTYMGRQRQTRAGYNGAIDTDVLKDPAKANGFGVFAYYTGTATYDATNYPSTGDLLAPNFMYNQHVYVDDTKSTVTNWYYSPIKYWPNEVVGTTSPVKGVDDQENDTDNDPATTTYENGGNVSFFAYAPWVELVQNTANAQLGAVPSDGEVADGIVAVSGNSYKGDPYVQYIIPRDGKTVDLLWGTKGNTSVNVNNEGNTGSEVGTYKYTGSPTTYVASLLDGYVTNTDLTKQKTTGTIDFLFKHALAKVGGSYTGTGEGDDDEASTPTNGLMVVLDLDKDGQETGGQLEAAGSDIVDAQTKYTTKVTVKHISITSSRQVTDAGKTAQAGGTFDINHKDASEKLDYVETLKNEGVFNLATGVWSSLAVNETSAIEHNVTAEGKTTEAGLPATAVVSGELSQKIAEPSAALPTGAEGFKSLPIGVTTVPKNVYEDEGNPLVFIPGTRPVLEVEVEYVVRTYDPNLANGYSQVTQKIKKNLAFGQDVELNKAYNLLIHLGLTSVKFTASVSDWDVNNVSGSTQLDPVTGNEVVLYEADEDVYDPINVDGKVSALNVFNLITNSTSAVSGSNVKTVSEFNNDYGTTTLEGTYHDITALPSAGLDGSGDAYVQLAVGATYTPTNTTAAKPINLTGNAAYTISYPVGSPQNWAHLDATGKLTVDKNTSKTNRTATITVTYGTETATITATQSGRTVTAVTLGTLAPTTVLSSGGTVTLATGQKIKATFTDNIASKSAETTAKAAATEDVDVTDVAQLIISDDDGADVTVSGTTATFGPNYYNSVKTVKLKANYAGVQSSETSVEQSTATSKVAVANLSATSVPAAGATVKVEGVTVTYTDAESHTYVKTYPATYSSSTETGFTDATTGDASFNVLRSTSETPVTSTITVGYTDVEGSQTATQNVTRLAVTDKTLTLTVSPKTFSAAGTTTAKVTAVMTYKDSGANTFDEDVTTATGTGYTFTDESDATITWLSISGSALTVEANTTGAERTGKIKATNSGKDATVTIKQGK